MLFIVYLIYEIVVDTAHSQTIQMESSESTLNYVKFEVKPTVVLTSDKLQIEMQLPNGIYLNEVDNMFPDIDGVISCS
jgi:hypothetical protein